MKRRFTLFAGTALAVVLGATSLSVITHDTPADATQTVLGTWNPEALPLLTASTGTGVRTPVLRTDVVDGTSGFATSLQPILTWRDIPSAVGQVRFEISTVATSNPTTVWTGSAVANAGVAQATVATGKLEQAKPYRWRAYSVSDPSVQLPWRILNVDVQRAKVQGSFDSGPVQVAQTTGEIISIYQSSAVLTKEGKSAFSLYYRPTNRAQAGLPAGWRLEPGTSTTTWMAIRRNTDGSVTLTSQSGEAVSFVKADTSGDSYKPEFGPNQNWPGGSVTTLVPETLGDGTTQFTATEQNKVVTVFSPISLTANPTIGAPAKVYASGSLALQQRWSGDRLRAVVDPTTGSDVYTFKYSGTDTCPSQTAMAGAVAAPAGMLCGVTDWNQTDYGIYYSADGTTHRISRIIAGVGSIENAGVTDYQWDASNRLVGIRTPDVSSVVASGAVTGLGAQDPRALFQMTYDTEGRVASVTPPAGLLPGATQTAESQGRIPTVFTYTPTFTGTVAGKVISQVSSDPTTMLIDWTSAGTGGKMTMKYDKATGNLLEESDSSSGSVTRTVYDDLGRPIEQDGPTTAGLGSSSMPKTVTAYDQNENGAAWKGLATFYWDNAGFEGAPQTSSVGPVLDGSGNPPATLSFNFPNPPPGVTPAAGSWAARMTGSYLAPLSGSYVFSKSQTPTASLWIQGHPCLPTCQFSFQQGERVSVRVDVTSAAPGINLQVTTPGAISGTAVPIGALRPDLGLATSEYTFDSLSASSPTGVGTPQKLKVSFKLDPSTGQVIDEIAPSGSVVHNTFNADGTAASTTNAAGETMSSTYYGAQETATVACNGATGVGQRGLLKSVTRPGRPDATQVYGSSGNPSAITQGSGSGCGSNLDNATGSTAVSAGPDGATGVVLSHASPFYLNNPMRSMQATISNHGVRTMVVSRDLLGRIVSETDEWNTTTTTVYDPETGLIKSSTETTALGVTRVKTFVYNADGQTTQMLMDGKVLETATFDATNGLMTSSKLANGVEVQYRYGANLQVASVSYTFPDGTTASDTGTYSVGGRLLCHGASAPDGTATQCFGADPNGKIISESESGTLPVLASNWTASYAGAQGANGDRSGVTAQLTTAGKTALGTTASSHATTAAYASGDALSSLTVAGANKAVTADSGGRITQIGATTLTYDGTGNLVSVAKTGRGSITYGYGPNGMNEQIYTPASTAPASPRTAFSEMNDPAPAPAMSPSATSTTSPSTTSTTAPKSTTSSTTSSSTTTSTTVPTTTPKAAPKAVAPTPIVVRFSGEDLLLDEAGKIVGQVIDLTSGPTVGLDATGAAVRWSYPDLLGSAAWSSTASSPSNTVTYDAWGTWNAVLSRPQITDPLSLVMSENGWAAGQGGSTNPVDPKLVQLGARTYDTVVGRFLQPDPLLASTNPYLYANGDPVDGTDPTGAWGSWGDIFSTLISVVVGVAGAILAPVTGGASAFLAGFLITTAVTAAVDFGAAVIGQAIDQGGFGSIDWTAALVSSAIGTGISLVTLGASRLIAAPRMLGLHQKAVAFFTNQSKWKALRKAPATDIGDVMSWAAFKKKANYLAEYGGGSYKKSMAKGAMQRILWIGKGTGKRTGGRGNQSWAGDLVNKNHNTNDLFEILAPSVRSDSFAHIPNVENSFKSISSQSMGNKITQEVGFQKELVKESLELTSKGSGSIRGSQGLTDFYTQYLLDLKLNPNLYLIRPLSQVTS